MGWEVRNAPTGEGLAADKIWNPEAEVAVEGKYLGKKEPTGKMTSALYVLETKTGTTGVWGSAVLDAHFREVPIGNSVRIEFLGKEKSLKNPGRTYNNYQFSEWIEEE